MIQVLNKAFDILDYMARDPKSQKKLQEISGHFKMNAGTCANILQTMVRHKYLDQASARGSYMLGPMIYYLSHQSACHGVLISAAESPMADLAKQVSETVLLVTLRGNERFIIIQIDGNQSVQIGRNMFQNQNVYQTATGRLLLAHLNEKEIRAIVNKNGLPKSNWPEASSMPKLKRALEKILRQGWSSHKTTGDVIGIAYPIREKNKALFDNDKVVTALGLFLPAFRFKGKHKAAIMKGMSLTADAISKRLVYDGTKGKLK